MVISGSSKKRQQKKKQRQNQHFVMKITQLRVFQSHLGVVVYASLLGIVLVTVMFLIEMRRRRNQRKKYERICCHCRVGEVERLHVRVKLSPDLTGGFMTKLLSCMDYLCQTQVTCLNPECTYKCEADDKLLGVKKGDNMPFAEKTEVKQWGFRSRLFRFKQLRQTVTEGQLIGNSYVDEVLDERGLKPKVRKPPTGFKRQVVLPPEVTGSFRGVNPKK
jgi:hypothetical protein